MFYLSQDAVSIIFSHERVRTIFGLLSRFFKTESGEICMKCFELYHKTINPCCVFQELCRDKLARQGILCSEIWPWISLVEWLHYQNYCVGKNNLR